MPSFQANRMSGDANSRRWLWSIARILVCALALAWVVRRLAWDELSAAFSASNKTLIELAFLVFLPAPVLQAVRLVWMLRAQDISLSHWESLKLTLAGNFFNSFVPAGAVGGDLVKGYYITQRTSQKTEAVTAVLLDRGLGLFTFVIIAMVGLLFASGEQTRAVRPWLYGLSAVGLVAVVFVISRRLRSVLRFERWVDRLPRAEQFGRVAPPLCGCGLTGALPLVRWRRRFRLTRCCSCRS